MKWIFWIVAVLVVAVAVAWIIGALLPRAHTAACSARFESAPRALYDSIVDVLGAKSWRKDVREVVVLTPRGGQFAWSEETSSGTVEYVREVDEPPLRVVTRIASEELPWGGTWTYRLEADGGGTKVTITEDGFVKPALFRFLARFVFGHHGTIEDFLRALAAKHGETITVVREAP
ncbi:MAG TPA: SRPBCC family protein [Planctomycetota bacterium]|nr:SRPBCC family protein [Planctomycetota bacterium]